MTTQTRSATRQMNHAEALLQGEMQRTELYKLLESTYDADVETMGNAEVACYAEIKSLEKKIGALHSAIIAAHASHDARCRDIVPYDESLYEASLQTLCDAELACYAEIRPLETQIKMIEGNVVRMLTEFDIKYQPSRQM